MRGNFWIPSVHTPSATPPLRWWCDSTHYQQLCDAERKALGRLHAAGQSQAQIAKLLCRHPSTISRERHRNSRPSRHWPAGR